MVKFSDRLGKLAPYPFVEISRIIAEKRAAGADVVTFGIGDPDIPTPQPIIDRLLTASQHAPNHRYPETDGLPEMRRAFAQWYDTRFDVKLDPDTEVLPLIGAKEGIGHAAFSFLDPGDIALIPDPAYPVYGVGTMFAGAEAHIMPLYEKNGWLPELDAIPSDVAEAAKVMWLNYPNNPTGAIADLDYFAKVVTFAKKYDIIVCHDGPYTEVAYDGYEPISFLEAEGAKDVGIEFHSLSKSFNMTGWRVGMAVGNAEVINALMIVKSNIDSGIFQAVQYAGIAALNGPQDIISKRNKIYEKRRDKLVTALTSMGLDVEPPKASLYVWAKLPDGLNSGDFATNLIDKANVVVTPGRGYGEAGEGYIRCSLTVSDEELDRAIARLSSVKISDLL